MFRSLRTRKDAKKPILLGSGWRFQALIVSLSLLAGYVDAIGYLKTGAFFVSFMSGNSTRLGIGAAGDLVHAGIALSLIVSFVVGVVSGAMFGSLPGAKRQTCVLLFISVLLAAAALLNTVNCSRAAVIVAAIAMGAENMVFDSKDEVPVGITFMTGTLVNMGRHLAENIRGNRNRDWLPYLRLWLGMIAGALIGALLFPALGLAALWFAVPFALGLAFSFQFVIASKHEPS